MDMDIDMFIEIRLSHWTIFQLACARHLELWTQTFMIGDEITNLLTYYILQCTRQMVDLYAELHLSQRRSKRRSVRTRRFTCYLANYNTPLDTMRYRYVHEDVRYEQVLLRILWVVEIRLSFGSGRLSDWL